MKRLFHVFNADSAENLLKTGILKKDWIGISGVGDPLGRFGSLLSIQVRFFLPVYF